MVLVFDLDSLLMPALINRGKVVESIGVGQLLIYTRRGNGPKQQVDQFRCHHEVLVFVASVGCT